MQFWQLCGFSSSAIPRIACGRKWCARRDLNPHIFRYWNLNPARLPVPPRARGPRAAAYSKDRPLGNPPCACSLVLKGESRCSKTRPFRKSPGPTPRSRPSRGSRHPYRRRPRRARQTSTCPRLAPNRLRRRFRRWGENLEPPRCEAIEKGRGFRTREGSRPPQPRLTPQSCRSDDRLEIRKRSVEVMRLRGVEEDHVEPPVDHRPDDAAAAP
jgi:hypothetical protein